MLDVLREHKGKIATGSGLVALIGTLTVSGLQYQENTALTDALKATQSALGVMGERYEKLVNMCMERIDETER